jgi:hypothetical protein
MNPDDIARMAGQVSMGMVQVPRPPTTEEQANVKRVEAMNLRTQAGLFATQLLTAALARPAAASVGDAKEVSLLRTTPEALLRAWHVMAHGIEDYIRGE